MASVFELDYTKKHGVVETTLMASTFSGAHFYNLVSTADVDNGSVVVLKAENYKEGDVFTTAVPAATDKIVLITTPVKIYEEYGKQCQEECFFYNKAGEIMRGTEVTETDRFALSTEAFGADAVPAKGKYVVVDGTTCKLTTSDTAPTGKGFVGYIYGVASNGNFKIFVKKNQEVTA